MSAITAASARLLGKNGQFKSCTPVYANCHSRRGTHQALHLGNDLVELALGLLVLLDCFLSIVSSIAPGQAQHRTEGEFS
jgi:hypothetical protein